MPPNLKETIIRTLPVETRDSIALALESDVLGSGKFGECWLIATSKNVFRIEPANGGQTLDSSAIIVGDWPLNELQEFRYEELVDAGCLVAKREGVDLELIRGSTSHASQIAAIAKKLNRLRNEGVADPHLETRRICPPSVTALCPRTATSVRGA